MTKEQKRVIRQAVRRWATGTDSPPLGYQHHPVIALAYARTPEAAFNYTMPVQQRLHGYQFPHVYNAPGSELRWRDAYARFTPYNRVYPIPA